jgi:hypothetical protein
LKNKPSQQILKSREFGVQQRAEGGWDTVFIPTDNCAGGIFCRKPRVCASCRLVGDSILLFLENLDVLLHFLQKVSKRQSPQCMV